MVAGDNIVQEAVKIAKRITEEEVVAFASQIAAVPSFTGEETPMSRWLTSWFEERGYQTELMEVEPGRWMTMARLPGTGGGVELMFNGHIDVDPVPLGYEGDPFTARRDGDKLHAIGLWNQKGGIAAMIMAAEAVRQSGVKLDGDIVITPVVGELQGGVGTTYLLDQKGLRPDMVIVTEPWGADNAVTQHAGMIHVAINTLGTHGPDGPPSGIDAFQKMRTVIDALDNFKLSRYEPWEKVPSLPWLRIGTIVGGRGRQHALTAPYWNIDFCTVILDVRTVPGQTAGMVVQDLEEFMVELASVDDELRYEIVHPPDNLMYRPFTVDFPPADAPEDMPVVEALARNYKRVTGKEIAGRGLGGANILPYYSCDNGHWTKAGIQSVIFGPTGEGYTATQYVSISEMLTVARVMTATAIDLCSGPRETHMGR